MKRGLASIPQFTQNVDAIGKQSNMLGISTEALQRYRYAAGLADVSNQDLAKAFQTLNKNSGSGALAKSLEKIDKPLLESLKTAKTTEEAFGMITKRLRETADITKKSAVINAAFGKSGLGIVNMLGDMDSLMDEAGKFGRIFTREDIERAANFNDSLTRVKTALTSLASYAQTGAVKALQPFIDKFLDWYVLNKDIIGQKIEDAVGKIAEAFNFVVRVLKDVKKELQPVIDRFRQWYAVNKDIIAQKFKEFITDIAGAFKFLAGNVGGVIDFLKEFGPAILAAVVAFMAFQKVLAVIEAIKTAFAGIKLALSMGNPVGLIMVGIAALVGGVVFLSGKVGGLKNAFKVMAGTAIEVLQAVGVTLARVGKLILDVVLTPITLVMNGVIELLQAALALAGKIPGMGDISKNLSGGLRKFQDAMNSTVGVFAIKDDLADFSDIGAAWRNVGSTYNEYKDAEDARKAAAEAAKLMSGTPPVVVNIDNGDIKDALYEIAENTAKTASGVNEKVDKAKKLKIEGPIDFFTIMNMA
jgi:tetratricopeptide (TPR) repeat protein